MNKKLCVEPSLTSQEGIAQPLTQHQAAHRQSWRLDEPVAAAKVALQALQRQGEDRIWRLAAKIERVLDDLLADRNAWRDAMQRQTPMGSEFCSPAECEAYANARRAEAHNAKCEVARLRRALPDGRASDRVTADAEPSTGRLDTNNSTPIRLEKP